MQVVQGYKTELDLTNEQRTACLKHAGCARFAYNWGLARSIEVYRTTGKRPTAIDLHKDLNKLKQTDYPWMYEVSKCAPQEALRDLDIAYKNFYRRAILKKQGKWKGKLGFPVFKKKSKGIGSFRLTGAIKVSEKSVQLPRIGKVRKAQWHGVHLVVIDRFSPSSQLCSNCKWRNETLTLADRVFVCQDCGAVKDRDYNAAQNILRVAVSSIDTQYACGQRGAGSCNGTGETALVEAGTNHHLGMS